MGTLQVYPSCRQIKPLKPITKTKPICQATIYQMKIGQEAKGFTKVPQGLLWLHPQDEAEKDNLLRVHEMESAYG